MTPPSDDHLAIVVREPVGVVGLVLPWNFPLLMLAWKIGPALAAGFVEPTCIALPGNDHPLTREEIFGPVLSILKFETEEEAVQIANDTPYGLTNYVQSQDGARCNRLARQLRSGMVEINGQGRGAGSPFGGMKMSGNGREGGSWGIHDFVEVKAVSGWSV